MEVQLLLCGSFLQAQHHYLGSLFVYAMLFNDVRNLIKGRLGSILSS